MLSNEVIIEILNFIVATAIVMPFLTLSIAIAYNVNRPKKDTYAKQRDCPHKSVHLCFIQRCRKCGFEKEV